MDENNYNELYATHQMCRNCNRRTNGVDDFKNAQTGKLTKTCRKCRACVLSSQAKKADSKPLTLKQQISMMKKALNSLEVDQLEVMYDQHPRLKEILL